VAKEQDFDLIARKPAKTSPWLVVIFSAQIVLLLAFFLFGGRYGG
jgi:uncharacterized membrane protein YjjP (DUF1212 family)